MICIFQASICISNKIHEFLIHCLHHTLSIYFLPGRVDVPFTRYAPHRSRRAAFSHPAPHMANRMSDLCVSDTFLPKINFLVMSISVYWTSFFLGYRHMWLPSLQWHYSPSSVSGKGDSFQFLPPLRTEHATFTAFRSRIYNA